MGGEIGRRGEGGWREGGGRLEGEGGGWRMGEKVGKWGKRLKDGRRNEK